MKLTSRLEIGRVLSLKDMLTGQQRVFQKLKLYSKATSLIATAILANTALEADRQVVLEWI